MYVSNENPTLVDVYFDDVVMTHTPTNVIQYNEYYPFGLQTANSWTREGVTGNRYLYNAANELNATTGWYEMFFRDYDPVLGRMLQVDPYASSFASMTPYNYAGNSPLVMNDPSGGVMSPYKREMINDYNIQAYELGMSNAGFLSKQGQSVLPGSQNHWSDSFSNSYRDYFLMSVGNFENKYGISIGEFRENLLGVSTSDPVLINLALRGYDISKPIWVDETTYKYLGTAGNEHRFRKTENSYLITSGVSQTQGNGPGLMHAGMGTDVSLYLLSVASYAGGVYEDVRARQIAKQTKGMLNEWQQIRNFNKSYKTGRQATLASNIIKNVNTLDAMKVASRRMIGVGLVLGVADMANNDFSAESVGWFAADTIMTGIGLTGWGAPIAGVYFLGRFAYGIYDMATKDGN